MNPVLHGRGGARRPVGRLRRTPGVLLVVVLAACGDGSGGAPASAAGDPSAALRADPRVAELLEPCSQVSLYDEDIGQTSVLIGRLVGKLEFGQLEALKRAKEELAEIGAPVVPALRRLIERSYANAFHAAYIENALGTATRMESPAARELLLLGFDHPQEAVRAKAVEGLRLRHATPADFDRLLARLAAPESSSMRSALTKALFQADRDRAEDLTLGWIRRGEERGLWLVALPELAATRDPETRAACAELAPRLEDPLQRAYLAASAAAGGDADARAYLRTRLEEGPWNERTLVADVLPAAGWVEPLIDLVRGEQDVRVLVVAMAHLARADGWSDGRREALAPLLDAGDPRVRSLALELLVERGDPAALDRAIAQLGVQETEPLQAALLALREPLSEDPALRARARAVLEARNAAEEGLPLQDRMRTLKAIGTLPTAWSAELLVDVGRDHPGERLEGLRVHEWVTIHAGNTGDAGRARLYELLDEEDDPVRRIDLIRALSLERSADARTRLFALAEGDARSEVEVLYAAHRLARVGPSHLVAPRLKRVMYGVESAEVRRALSCLLWHWY